MAFTSAASDARTGVNRIIAPVVAARCSKLILMALLLLQIQIDGRGEDLSAMHPCKQTNRFDPPCETVLETRENFRVTLA